MRFTNSISASFVLYGRSVEVEEGEAATVHEAEALDAHAHDGVGPEGGRPPASLVVHFIHQLLPRGKIIALEKNRNRIMHRLINGNTDSYEFDNCIQ